MDQGHSTKASIDEVPVCLLELQGEPDVLDAMPPDEVVRKTEMLQIAFESLLRRDDILRRIVTSLADESRKAVVFGGWIRDHLLSGSRVCEYRDIDLVVGGTTCAELSALIGPAGAVNLFGGIHAKTTATSLDVWPLAETFLIRRLQLPCDFETLPQTTVFRINSVIFRPAPLWDHPSLSESGCWSALQHREISFQNRMIPFPPIQAARALMYAAKLQFHLAPEVAHFIRRVCATEEARQAAMQGLAQYCPASFLSRAISQLHSLMHGI